MQTVSGTDGSLAITFPSEQDATMFSLRYLCNSGNPLDT